MMIVLAFLIGFILNSIFRRLQNYTVYIYGKRVFKEDYFISPTDPLFFFIVFLFHQDLFFIFFLYLGFISNPIVRKFLFGRKEIRLKNVFLSPLSFFIPLFFMSLILKFFAHSYMDFHVYLFSFVVYLFSNKFLSIFIMESISKKKVSFIQILNRVFPLGFAEGFIFSQFILTYTGFIFFVDKQFINFFMITLVQIILIRMLYFANSILAAYQNIVDMLLKLLQEYDMDTYAHSERVSIIAKIVAKNFGLTKEEIESIILAAKLHDIGKIDTPTSILRKEGKLTETEFKIITLHPVVAAQIVEDIVSEEQTKFIKYHHFYPTVFDKPVTYNDIPVGARIIMTADVYDALRSKRKYKPALTHNQVIVEMFKMVEKRLIDPQIFSTLISSVEEFNYLYEEENKENRNIEGESIK